jgi:dethiobiotin synthetase
MISNTSKQVGFLVTGTDTEVGKTLVSGALLLKLSKKYSRVSAYKPVVAGLEEIEGHFQNEDLMTLSLASNFKISSEEMCPFQLQTPAAPHLVAQQENLSLDYKTIIESYEAVKNKVDAIVVEGVGGFCVPFSNDKNSADFAKDIGLPVVLVVGMRLGCINHALLSAEAIRARGLNLAGWIANTLQEPMPMLDENIATLQTLLKTQFLGKIPSLSANLARTPYSIEALEFSAKHIQIDI